MVDAGVCILLTRQLAATHSVVNTAAATAHCTHMPMHLQQPCHQHRGIRHALASLDQTQPHSCRAFTCFSLVPLLLAQVCHEHACATDAA
jgi:hypothetical protein